MTYVLSTNEKTLIQNLVNNEDWPTAYFTLGQILEDPVQSEDVDEGVMLWVKIAGDVNADSGGWWSEYVRTYTYNASGETITDEQFQNASDTIAEDFFDLILDPPPGTPEGTIPTIAQIIENDVVGAVNELGLEDEDWAGTLLANELFGYPAVENFIDTPQDILEQAGRTFWTAPQILFGDALEAAAWLADALNPFNNAKTKGSPLIIDLDADGIELVALSGTSETFFDLDNDGFAQQTGWIAADQDGFLARDINEDGIISDASELFGTTSVDGFGVLAELDSNGDLRINAFDDDWDELLIWKDINGDAVTDDGELFDLSEFNIESIDLANVAASTQTLYGHSVSHTSTVTFTGGSTGTIADIWFNYDHTNTAYIDDYTLDVEALFLPTLRGSGWLPDLHIVASEDEDLFDLIADLATGFSLGDFADSATLNGDIEDILYTWAGVDGVATDSRGDWIDARKLEFLEQLVGENWLQLGHLTDPAAAAAADLEYAFDQALYHLKAQLLVQVGARDLFGDTAVYNAWTGEIEGDLDLDEQAIDDLVAFATAQGVDAEAFWDEVALFIHYSKGVENLTTQEETWLDDAIYASDSSLSWSGIEANIPSTQESVTYNEIDGTSGDDNGGSALYGTNGADELRGQDGNDELYGAAGHDLLYGGSGNDVLDTGSGGDTAYGNTGDDTYVFTSGNDIYSEGTDTAGDDVIILPSGIEFSDLIFSVVNGHDLLIEVGTIGTIQIDNQFTNKYIETLEFDDLSTFDLTTLNNLVQYGTNGDDILDGIVQSAGDDDVIYGLGGDDDIESGTGNDIVDGGIGNDTINLGGGDDTLVASAGFDHVYFGTGFDTLYIPDGYDEDDITLSRLVGSPNHLLVQIAGLGQIEATSYFVGTSNAFEQISFANEDPDIAMSGVSFTTFGTDGNDTISGVTLSGSENDVFESRGGDDTIYGGAGNDTYVHRAGTETITEQSGVDKIVFGEGFDQTNMTFATSGPYGDTLEIYFDSELTVTIVEHYNTNKFIETLEFSDSSTFDLTSLAYEKLGTSGNDSLVGRNVVGLQNLFYGYDGNDTIVGGDGGDTAYGGAGADYMNLKNGENFAYGDAGNDTFIGGSGVDIFYGGDDNDYFLGYGDNDFLYGDAGNDDLYGGTGDDYLLGGTGTDDLYGQGGADTFAFLSSTAFGTVDFIKDFNAGDGDMIDIADVISGYDPMTDAITDFVEITDYGSHSILKVDADGGADNFVQIAQINNVTGLTDEAALEASGTLVTV